MFQSFFVEGAGINGFCQRRVSAQEGSEKENVFGYLTINSLIGR